MNNTELATGYQKSGWFANMTPAQIRDEVSRLEQETARADKRTYNGKMTRTFNSSKIAIAKIILEAQEEDR